MEVKRNKKAAHGFKAASEEYMDMIEAGIVDPTKVTRGAAESGVDCGSHGHHRVPRAPTSPRRGMKMPGGMPGGMGGGDMY